MKSFRLGSRSAVAGRPALQRLEPRLAPAAFTVSVGGDVTTGFSANSLRGVLTSLAGSGDATNSIAFAFGSPTTITLAAALPAIAKNVTVLGQGAASTTISGNSAVRVFDIAAAGTVTVGFSNLTLTKGSSTLGGAVRVLDESVTFTNVVLTSSSAAYGGLVATTGAATLAFAGCTLAGGSASSNGGAVYLDVAATVTLAGSTLSGNTAGGRGGAVYFNLGGSLTADQATFSGNTATGGGGAVSLWSPTATFRNSTFTGNAAGGEGGGAIRQFSAASTTLVGTIVAGNTASGGAPDVSNPTGTVNATSSLIGVAGSGSGLTLATDANNQKGTTAAPLAPGLLPLADYGGRVQTHLPLATSPAVNKGTNPQGFTTDARGAGFPRELPTGSPDIGAVETAPPTLTVTTLADTVANDGVLSLREAILAVNYAPDSNTIAFQAGLTGTVSLTSALPTLTSSAAITGAGATITVSGNGQYRPFTVDYAGGVSTVAFGDLTLTKGSGGNGGAVFVADESVAFTNVVLSDSTASFGGLVYAAGAATLAFAGSTLAGGSAATHGGAVYLKNDSAVTVANSTLSGNTAGGRGGAVYFSAGGSLTADQATFSANTATTGGAVSLWTAAATFRNCTLTGNAAGSGGGGAIRQYFFASTTLVSTIVAGNTATGTGPDISNPIGTVDATNCVIGVAGSGLTLTTDSNNQKGTAAAPLSPGLGGLANNGGRVQTHLPLAGSPAVDKGSNPAGFATDARGAGFPRELPTGRPDIGAAEADPATITVTTLADTVDAADGAVSLREAIIAANYAPASNTIAFQAGLTGTVTLTSALPTLTSSAAITGAGAAVAVSGDGKYRPFTLDYAGGVSTVAFGDLTITKGSAGSGGAVFVAGESVAFTNVVLSDSTAAGAGGLVYATGAATLAFTGCTLAGGLGGNFGGAVFLAAASTVTVANSTISGNKASAEGGAVNFAAGGSLTADQATFSANTTTAGGGGALYLQTPTAVIRNSTLTGNAAGSSGGGAIRLGSAASATLVSTIVAGNTATGTGPDIGNPSGTVNATNCLIGVAGSGSGLTLTTDTANQKGTAAAPLDAKLGPLADNGGRVQTHLPLAGSPAVDKGGNPQGFATDARGAGFPRELPTGLPDVAAAELDPPTLTVTTLADTVANDGVLSLREAILTANAVAGGNTIAFQAGLTGTVTLTSALPTLTSSADIRGAGATITVSGNSLYRPFEAVNAAAALTLAFSDLTITKGSATNGGAVRVEGERALFTNVVLSDSTAANAGGLVDLSGGATAIFVGCTLTGGKAAVGGAAFALGGEAVSFVNSTLSGNQAGGRGGAVCFDAGGRLTADQTTFSGNQAGTATATAGGGAVYAASAAVTLRNATLTNNSGGSDGGGAVLLGSASAALTLVSTIVAGNTAFGAPSADIGNPSGTVDAYDSLIGVAGAGSGLTLAADRNTQKGTTGSPLNAGLLALANNGGPVRTHALTAGSPARDRGSNAAGYPFDARGAGFPRERPAGRADVGAFEAAAAGPLATLAAGNVVAPGGTSHTFTVTYSDEAAINAATVNGNLAAVTVAGPAGATVTAAAIDVAANGPIRTVTYTVSAPGGTWDAADNGTYTVTLAANQAKNGGGTAVPGGPLGTFAVQAGGAVYLVTTTADSGPGSLRAAVAAANGTAGVPDAVAFAPAVFNVPRTILLSGGELTITDGLTIRGPGAGKLTLDAGGVAGRRLFTVNGTGTLAVAVADLTVTGGRGDFGGAVNVTGDESVTFTNVAFTKNAASGFGGAISVGNAAATLTLDGCTLDANTAATSGGAVNFVQAGTLVTRASTFSGNSAGFNGGAVYFFNGGSVVMAGSTLSGNTAAGRGGGAVYFYGPVGPAGLSFANCTFDSNAATAGLPGLPAGGAVLLAAFTGALSLVQSTVTGNTVAAGQTGAGVGVLKLNSGGAGAVLAVNSIVAGNRTTAATPAAADFGSETLTPLLAANLAYTGGTPGMAVGGTVTAGFDAAANLNPLEFNGGPTRTRSPKAGSAAIDAGVAAVPLSADQRGAGYARVVGAAADLGAVERPATGGDTTAPSASATTGGVTTRKGTAYTFTVTLTDNVAVNAATVQGADFTVTGPGGYSQAATLVSLSSGSNTTPLTATLSVVPPGGAWDAVDNGVYTVGLTGNVQDAAGNVATPATLGTFSVLAPVGVLGVTAKLADGTVTPLSTAGQRSVIPQIVITFDGPATGADVAASYKLVNTSKNATVAVGVSTATVNGRTVVTLTPAGGGLADGYYTLTAFGTAIATAGGGGQLDGDDNGSAGGNYVLNFHRFAGDVTGDTAVDGDDLAQLAQAFNSVQGDSNYRAWLDLDGDGAVDGNDLAVFAQSFALGVL